MHARRRTCPPEERRRRQAFARTWGSLPSRRRHLLAGNALPAPFSATLRLRDGTPGQDEQAEFIPAVAERGIAHASGVDHGETGPDCWLAQLLLERPRPCLGSRPAR